MTRYVSRERRVTSAATMTDFFNRMGWFDRMPEERRLIARELEHQSTDGITAETLHVAALYVELYTGPDALEGLGTTDIMTLIDRECTTLFELRDYDHGPSGIR